MFVIMCDPAMGRQDSNNFLNICDANFHAQALRQGDAEELIPAMKIQMTKL